MYVRQVVYAEDTYCPTCRGLHFVRIVLLHRGTARFIDGYCTKADCNPDLRRQPSAHDLANGVPSAMFDPFVQYEEESCDACGNLTLTMITRGGSLVASECLNCGRVWVPSVSPHRPITPVPIPRSSFDDE